MNVKELTSCAIASGNCPAKTIILTLGKKTPFARVKKELLDDPNISFTAKGIMAYLLGKPDDWKLRVTDLINHSSQGKHATRAALAELRKAGYVHYQRPKKIGEHGVWQVCDSQMFRRNPDLRDDDKGDADNQHLNKSDSTKNDFTKSKESKETPFSNGVKSSKKITPVWKPDSRSKQEKLDSLAIPNFPSEIEFDAYIESLGNLVNFRTDLYAKLCDDKWHQWKEPLKKWAPIRDWKAYCAALNTKIEEVHDH